MGLFKPLSPQDTFLPNKNWPKCDHKWSIFVRSLNKIKQLIKEALLRKIKFKIFERKSLVFVVRFRRVKRVFLVTSMMSFRKLPSVMRAAKMFYYLMFQENISACFSKPLKIVYNWVEATSVCLLTSNFAFVWTCSKFRFEYWGHQRTSDRKSRESDLLIGITWFKVHAKMSEQKLILK